MLFCLVCPLQSDKTLDDEYLFCDTLSWAVIAGKTSKGICMSIMASEHLIIVTGHYLSLLNFLSQDGSAALHIACQEGHARVAEILLQAGASLEQETKVRWGVSQD